MIDDIAELLVGKDNEKDLERYARLIAIFGLAVVSNSARAKVIIPNDNKSIPINVYGIFTGGSGIGKTKSVNFVMDLIEPALNALKDKVRENIDILDPFASEELIDLTKDGVSMASFYKSLTDSATLKLMRVMDLVDYYSINYVVDEFAGKVLSEYEMLSTTIIEIFDKGNVPPNLRSTVKTNKAKNQIPMNMLAFGSPHLLFETDTNIEKAFIDLLQAGMARRTLFANAVTSVNRFTLNANANRSIINSIQDKFVQIQDKYDHKELLLSDEAKNAYSNYMNENTEQSIAISDYRMIEKIYAKNKSWLALKLSGLIAISNLNDRVEIDDFNYAIQMVEESSNDLITILDRPEKYELIVDWLMEQDKSESEYTMTQSLPFYKEVKSKKQFWDLAKGYAYENNITLMIEDRHNMTFYQAKNKKKTNLNEPLIFSYSNNMTEGYYSNDDIMWDNFHKVVQKDGICYSAHRFKEGYRNRDNALAGVQLLMLDIDDGVSIELAKMLFEEYTYLIATTKSHLKDKNGVVAERFRIIIPMANIYELDAEQHNKFMANIMEDLPIEVDRQCKDISRFFYGADGEYWYNEGILFDADKYVPNTQEEEHYKKKGVSLAKKNINGISQYIIRNEASGRNSSLIKLALLLADKGYDEDEIKSEVLRVNKQFSNPLAESEINRTIFRSSSVRRAIENNDESEDEEPYEIDEFATVDK